MESTHPDSLPKYQSPKRKRSILVDGIPGIIPHGSAFNSLSAIKASGYYSQRPLYSASSSDLKKIHNAWDSSAVTEDSKGLSLNTTEEDASYDNVGSSAMSMSPSPSPLPTLNSSMATCHDNTSNKLSPVNQGSVVKYCYRKEFYLKTSPGRAGDSNSNGHASPPLSHIEKPTHHIRFDEQAIEHEKSNRLSAGFPSVEFNHSTVHATPLIPFPRGSHSATTNCATDASNDLSPIIGDVMNSAEDAEDDHDYSGVARRLSSLKVGGPISESDSRGGLNRLKKSLFDDAADDSLYSVKSDAGAGLRNNRKANSAGFPVNMGSTSEYSFVQRERGLPREVNIAMASSSSSDFLSLADGPRRSTEDSPKVIRRKSKIISSPSTVDVDENEHVGVSMGVRDSELSPDRSSPPTTRSRSKSPHSSFDVAQDLPLLACGLAPYSPAARVHSSRSGAMSDLRDNRHKRRQGTPVQGQNYSLRSSVPMNSGVFFTPFVEEPFTCVSKRGDPIYSASVGTRNRTFFSLASPIPVMSGINDQSASTDPSPPYTSSQNRRPRGNSFPIEDSVNGRTPPDMSFSQSTKTEDDSELRINMMQSPMPTIPTSSPSPSPPSPANGEFAAAAAAGGNGPSVNVAEEIDASSSIAQPSASKSRPLPDQSAFDNGSADDSVDQSRCFSSRASSPEQRAGACPETPARTPSWLQDSVMAGNEWSDPGALVSLADTFDDLLPQSDLSSPVLMRRAYGYSSRPVPQQQHRLSLGDNKVLVWRDDNASDVESSREEAVHSRRAVVFVRDFSDITFLGSGAFADVFKARERMAGEGGRWYAVKKSRRQFRSQKDRQLLLGEVHIMKRLGAQPLCEYIIHLVKAWQESGFFYVQVEYAEKGTLKDVMSDMRHTRRIIPSSTIWRVAHDVAQGLQHIHSHDIVHLDIKPHNLLISHDAKIQIGDFGLAAEVGVTDDGHEGDTKYLAPELLDSAERLPSADIFSFGLTLYELCLTVHKHDPTLHRHHTHHHARVAVKVSVPPTTWIGGSDSGSGDSCSIGSSSLAAGDTASSSGSGATASEFEFFNLPADGHLWHDLREGRAPAPVDRPEPLLSVISATMHPVPAQRPSAAQMLQIQGIKETASQADPDSILMNAAPVAKRAAPLNPRAGGVQGPARMSVSSSTFVALSMGVPLDIASLARDRDNGESGYDFERMLTPTGDIIESRGALGFFGATDHVAG